MAMAEREALLDRCNYRRDQLDLGPPEDKLLEKESRRVQKHGEPVQNYRRSVPPHLRKKVDEKREGGEDGGRWTNDDMIEFLDIVVTWEAYEKSRIDISRCRRDPSHNDHKKAMPLNVRPCDVMLWRMCISSAYSDAVAKDFADAGVDEADVEARSSKQVARFHAHCCDRIDVLKLL